MSKLYVSNANGDWWTVDTETGAGAIVYVIAEDKLTELVIEKYGQEALDDAGGQIGNFDKLERLIGKFGDALDIEF